MTLDLASWGFRRDAMLKDIMSIEVLIATLAQTVRWGRVVSLCCETASTKTHPAEDLISWETEPSDRPTQRPMAWLAVPIIRPTITGRLTTLTNCRHTHWLTNRPSNRLSYCLSQGLSSMDATKVMASVAPGRRFGAPLKSSLWLYFFSEVPFTNDRWPCVI